MPDVQTTVVKIPEPSYTTYYAGNEDADILHYGGLRVRLVGSGNLKMLISGLDDVKTKQLVQFEMSNPNGNMPFRLVNFNTQKARIKFYTNSLDEIFELGRVILFVRKLFTMSPSVAPTVTEPSNTAINAQ